MNKDEKDKRIQALENALEDIEKTASNINEGIENKYYQERSEGKKTDVQSKQKQQARHSEIKRLAGELNYSTLTLFKYDTWGEIWGTLNDLSINLELKSELSSILGKLSDEGHKFQEKDKKEAKNKIDELSNLVHNSSEKYNYNHAHYKQNPKDADYARRPNNIEYLKEHYVDDAFVMPHSKPSFNATSKMNEKTTHEVDSAITYNKENDLSIGNDNLSKAKELKERENKLRVAIEGLERVVELCKSEPAAFAETMALANKKISQLELEVSKLEVAYNQEMANYNLKKAKYYEKNDSVNQIQEETKQDRKESSILDKGIGLVAGIINGKPSTTKQDISNDENESSKAPNGIERDPKAEHMLYEIAMKQIAIEGQDKMNIQQAIGEILALMDKNQEERALSRCHRDGLATEYSTVQGMSQQDYNDFISTTVRIYKEVDIMMDEYREYKANPEKFEEQRKQEKQALEEPVASVTEIKATEEVKVEPTRYVSQWDRFKAKFIKRDNKEVENENSKAR